MSKHVLMAALLRGSAGSSVTRAQSKTNDDGVATWPAAGLGQREL
jgi:hypothetical protein